MADITQEALVELKNHAKYTHGTNLAVPGTAKDVRTYLSGTIYIYHTYVEAAANNPPVKYLVQINHSATGEDDKWVTIAEFAASIIAPDSEVCAAGGAATGQKVIPVASTTGFALGDIIYFYDATGPDDSEWAQIALITTNTSLTVIDNLTGGDNASAYVATNDVVYNDARRWAIWLDLTGVSYLRVVSTNFAATGSDWIEWVVGVFATDIE